MAYENGIVRMPKLAVIGSNGMLGKVVAATKFDGYEVIEVNRIGKPVLTSNLCVQIDSDLMGFESGVNLSEIDFVINCAGLIRQKIDEHDPASVASAITANYEIPQKLVSLSEKYNFKIIQIGTDCVYSGARGNYIETDVHDAVDLYGKSKSLGEIAHQNLSIVRSSIVGLEHETTNSLLSWFLSQPKGTVINGFNNQLWNGVTSLHFSKFLAGIIDNQEFDTFIGVHHVVPGDKVTKEDLLRYFVEAFDRQDIQINSVASENKLDMTLATSDVLLNEHLWHMAGYSSPLFVKEMIIEYSQFTKSGG